MISNQLHSVKTSAKAFSEAGTPTLEPFEDMRYLGNERPVCEVKSPMFLQRQSVGCSNRGTELSFPQS